MWKLTRRTFAAIALFGAAVLPPAFGADAFTNPSEAGPDFQIQGEYAGELGSGTKWGAQVVALGDGKFDVVGYEGGLPGDGWKRGDNRKKGKGETKDGLVTCSGDDWKGTIKDGALSIDDASGKNLGSLKKVERKSPTLGAKAPSGAVVLFDGTSADKFKSGKIVEDNLLGPTNCESIQQFQDHSLHIEFRTPFMPKARGQGRGNSGVYIQSRYECQVLDSFGLEGENNECGGIYSQVKPAVNMCFPPLAWQTYDIDFTSAKYDASGKKTSNAVISIKHNGVPIYENLEVKGHTPGRHSEGPMPDGVFLQNHGNPVAFRNIWVVEKK